MMARSMTRELAALVAAARGAGVELIEGGSALGASCGFAGESNSSWRHPNGRELGFIKMSR